MSDENLWGDITVDPNVETPLSILKAQGAALKEATKGILDGRVVQSSTDRRLVYEFRVVVPGLGNYSATILRIMHEMTLYPVHIVNVFTDEVLEAQDAASLRAALKAVFQSEEVRRIVRGLAAQAMEAAAPAG